MNFWIVSPNVGGKAEKWKKIILRQHVAVMGYRSHRPIGRRFVEEIIPDDVVLIARRHNWKPEVVGLGIVQGSAEQGALQGEFKEFDNTTDFGSLRHLLPFVPTPAAPEAIKNVLKHTMALVQLHPERHLSHRDVCSWMERLLRRNAGNIRGREMLRSRGMGSVGQEAHIARLIRNHKFGYRFLLERKIVRARKEEGKLLEAYLRWMKLKYGYMPDAVIKIGKLTCDCLDKKRHNLIEAKCSVSREDIRMAVGQLFDYSFHAPKSYRRLDMAILLPSKPASKFVGWLKPLNINVIWRNDEAFEDNTKNRRFT